MRLNQGEYVKRSFRGFTLIEALIALLVLSIGMLGVAAMQLKALQGAHAAYQRSIASLAAQDAQERLWAQLALGSGVCPLWSEAEKGDGDIPSWNDAWGDYLPDFSTYSSVSPPGNGSNADCQFTVLVDWTENRFEGEEATGFTYIVRLPGKENET